jgi:hypothetical protein
MAATAATVTPTAAVATAGCAAGGCASLGTVVSGKLKVCCSHLSNHFVEVIVVNSAQPLALLVRHPFKILSSDPLTAKTH